MRGLWVEAAARQDYPLCLENNINSLTMKQIEEAEKEWQNELIIHPFAGSVTHLTEEGAITEIKHNNKTHMICSPKVGIRIIKLCTNIK